MVLQKWRGQRENYCLVWKAVCVVPQRRFSEKRGQKDVPRARVYRISLQQIGDGEQETMSERISPRTPLDHYETRRYPADVEN